MRIKRSMSEYSDVIEVPTIKDAVSYLSDRDGNILVTTGAKESAEYTAIKGFKDRVFFRVLPIESSFRICIEAGIPAKNLFCAQGPFSEEMNYGMLCQTGAEYLVTKDSGRTGGFDEKYKAARRAGATIIVIARPDDDGIPFETAVGELSERFSIGMSSKRRISIIGIGMGKGTLTKEAYDAISGADILIGAKRMLETADCPGKPTLCEYNPERIVSFLSENGQYSKSAVLFSGDIEFYSGATKLIEMIDRNEFDIRSICGITSPVYFFSRIERPWQDVKMISAHGRNVNIIGYANRYPKVFSLLSDKREAEELVADLVRYGIKCRLWFGSDMGSENERLVSGVPENIDVSALGKLNVVYIENQNAVGYHPGIADSEFIRGDAPMTKSEVRALSVNKMHLTENSIVYDIGAGTGSVSIESALSALNGTVYAIEKEDSACALIEENKMRFVTPNVKVVKGTAPGVMKDLPVPTHAFIGGSSGNLKDIVSLLLQKNPLVRIIITAVTLETIAEIMSVIKEFDLIEEETTCISVDRTKRIGRYHLMDSQNPVYMTVVRR